MNKLSEPEKAYLAGIFDGEGSVWAYAEPGTERRYLRTAITNTDLELLNYVSNKTGLGKTAQNTLTKRYVNLTPKDKRDRWKPCYYWYIDGGLSLDFLEAIFPYLISKRKRASTAMSFQKLKNSHWHRPHSNLKKENELANRLHELNRRGIKR